MLPERPFTESEMIAIINPLAVMVHYTDTLMKILLMRSKAYLTASDQRECLPWTPARQSNQNPGESHHMTLSAGSFKIFMIIIVRGVADLKNKLMGFMVYF
jgi:hypothetical protein